MSNEANNEPLYQSFTHKQLEEAFSLVSNKTHWKDPIDTTIDAKDWPIVHAAIRFFTATTPKIYSFLPNNQVKVRAEGYRRGPAGDH